MPEWILPVQEFYARLNQYVLDVGLPYEVEDLKGWDTEAQTLQTVMGAAQGQSVLDCSCGWGRQAIALAKTGWQVTATDVSGTSLDFARNFASQEGAQIAFGECDMRELAGRFHSAFDWVVSCFALYELVTDSDIQLAVDGMFHALKPGGKCYLRQRDMDFLMEEQPRYIFSGEKRVPAGRILCIEDWEFESEKSVISLYAFLREDERKDRSDHFRWVTDTLGYRKRALRAAELQGFLQRAGFQPVQVLPKAAPWMELEVVAVKPLTF